MSVNQKISEKFEKLREQAQELIQNEPEIRSETPTDIIELIHELRIHQVELEMQNEELRRVQEELFDLHREYENLYEFAPCGYLTINHRGIITRINLTGAKLLEKPRQRLTHSGLSEFIAAKWQGHYLDSLKKAGETGKKQSIEFPLKGDKSPPCWIRAEIEADRDPAGGVVQWRVILIDISVQKADSERVKQLEDQLRQSQKLESLGTLAGGIAHEFNNMLSIILGNCEMAMEDVPKLNPAVNNLNQARLAALRARDVVQQLLTFSRQNGTKDSPLPTGSVMQESIKLIRASTPANIHIKLTISDNVAPVFGNATQINQLLIILCNNSADAMLNIAGLITIDVCNETIDAKHANIYPTLKPGRYVKIVLGDNGCGMDPATLAKVFEPYFTTKEFGKGTGIGLAVAHGIVERHKGSISVESRPGKGTLFTILLPTCGDPIEQAAQERIDLPTGDERILLVDDEPSLLRLVKQQLERLGYTVTGTTNPLEALKRFKSTPKAFDLVITDMAMPQMAGNRLAAEILNIAPKIPVILCTGHSERFSDKKAGDMGVCALAIKPLKLSELALKVRKALNKALEPV